MIRTFQANDVQAVIDPASAYEAVTAALEALATGQVETPGEIAVRVQPSGDVHVKGAHIRGTAWIVFKVASGSFPDAPNSGCTMLLRASTGAPEIIIDDGGWLTEVRTAAAGAIAADALAKPGPARVAILGTGLQARFQLEALRNRREVTATSVWGRNPDKADRFAAAQNATACRTVAEAVDGADIVVTTTSATEPFLHADLLEPGMHITAMGSDTVGKRELGTGVLDAADIVVADDPDVCVRVGELQHATEHLGRTVPLASVVAGIVPGRTTPTDITVADLCGIGTYDAAIAGLAASRLC